MENNTNQNEPILQHLQDNAIRAHYNVSFSPEKRGEQMIKEYSEELSQDIDSLKNSGIAEDIINDYKDRYERFFSSYLGAKGRTFSFMIIGPANFPVQRHAKANRSEQKHYEVFREWRIRAIKAIMRKSQPVKTFASELDRYKDELASMQKNHEIMKNCNAIIKKAKGKDCTSLLIDAGLSEEIARKIQTGDFAGRTGYPSFKLTNNNANMKRVEGMIKILEKKEEMRQDNPITNYTFDGGEMVINYEIDRIQIMFSTCPTNSELNEWTAKGLNTFNWSPSVMAWQRKITSNAMYCVRGMLKNIQKIN